MKAKKKLNIWLIQIGEPLPLKDNIRKMRAALLADQLNHRGHNVLWWVSAFDHFKKDWVFKEDAEHPVKTGLTIKALKGFGYKKNISLSRFLDHCLIARKFRCQASKLSKPDIIIASLPPHNFAYEAVKLAKANDIPILVDIRDEWPDIFLEYVAPSLRHLFRLFLFKDFAMAKEAMKNADGLIAMMNKLLEWGLAHAARDKSKKDKVFYLGHQKIRSQNITSDEIAQLVNDLKQKFVVTFIGTFGHYNNPSILVDCAQKMIGSNIQFVLAGDGEFFNEIKEKASGLANVNLPGWLNQEEIKSLLSHSHVGICPTTQIRDALPNKTFAYLSAGLPIISAFQGEIREIIEKYQIGFYYPPEDVNTLVQRIKELHDQPELYKKMSENARRVFDEMFDADKIYHDYANHIEEIAQEKAKH